MISSIIPRIVEQFNFQEISAFFQKNFVDRIAAAIGRAFQWMVPSSAQTEDEFSLYLREQSAVEADLEDPAEFLKRLMASESSSSEDSLSNGFTSDDETVCVSQREIDNPLLQLHLSDFKSDEIELLGQLKEHDAIVSFLKGKLEVLGLSADQISQWGASEKTNRIYEFLIQFSHEENAGAYEKVRCRFGYELLR